MKLNTQKRLAANVLGISSKRIKLDPERLSEIKEAITKSDIRSLMREGAITSINKQGVSRSRARYKILQRKKGRRYGKGSLKGTSRARLPRKTEWINKVRSQREFIKYLKQKGALSVYNYRLLRNKIKGGFFRSRRHVKLFIEEYNLAKKNGK